MTLRLARLALVLALFGATAAHAEPTLFKWGTLAPEGSSWMHLIHGWADKVRRETAGQVLFKFYTGGVAGDERELVRKMRFGELSGVGVTSNGLGLIQGEVRVLELPFLIGSYAELDHARTQLDVEIRQRFEEKGYVLLTWSDVGPIYLFSKSPLKSRADIDKARLWAWVDDQMVRTLFAEMRVAAVPLSLPDVLPALESGLIDSCYGSPLSMVALGWHARVRYMTSAPITFALAADVIVKSEFDRLTPAQKQTLLEASHELQERVIKQVREDNVKALAAMKRAGLTVVDADAALLKDFWATALKVREKLEPAIYSHDLRVRVEKMLEEYRAAHPRK